MKTDLTNLDNWEEELKVQLNSLNTCIEALFEPPFAWEEITMFIKAAINTVEELVGDAREIDDKKALIRAIWNHYDDQYALVTRIDELIDFKKAVPVVGSLIEAFDGKIIDVLIEQVLIPVVASKTFTAKAA